MTRPIALTQKQVTALCKGAEKAGYAPIVQFGNVLVRLVPADHAIPAQAGWPIDAAANDADLDAELAAFEAEHDND